MFLDTQNFYARLPPEMHLNICKEKPETEKIMNVESSQVGIKERARRIVVSVLLYIGIPIIAQAIDPIISVSSIGHLSYTVTHIQTIMARLSSANYTASYTLNAMVMSLWLVWIWAVLSSVVSISSRVLGRSIR